MTKCVTFTFDQYNYLILYELAESSGRTTGQVMGESLQVMRVLRQQVEQGYTEIILRNPKTGAERVVVIPSLQHSAPRAGESLE